MGTAFWLQDKNWLIEIREMEMHSLNCTIFIYLFEDEYF